MEEYGLGDLDQTNPSVAILAMEKRIGIVQDACSGCGARDKLIAAALAQNGSGFAKTHMEYVFKHYMQTDGSINWSGYFKESRTPSAYDARLREWMTGYQYDTEFMLRLYTMDLRELYRRGWKLPEGISEEDLDYMDELASGGN